MEPIHRTLGLRRSAALAAVAAAAALALPAAAGAAVTGDVPAAHTAVFTGDDAANTITISSDNGGLRHNIPVTPGGFESAADFDSNDAGVQALTAAAGTLTIDGGAGDDIIIGGPNLDALQGGDGDDRLTGGPNGAGVTTKEQISGGLGNDVMIWNNGDGNDINDGGDGVDETLVTNGAADDQMTVATLAGGGHQFARTNNPFTVDIPVTTERLNITSFGGNDVLAMSATTTIPTTIDAGSGNDTITTGAGADVIQGGTGVDTLNGAGGNDRILGNPGNDVMNGDAGDDTLVWNNGDGNDTMNGGDGLDRIENNLGEAADGSALSVLNGKVHYARTNNPFTLDVASSELFELNTFGGNDTLDTAPGLGALIAVVVDAGSGDDRITGGDEADTFFGGLGNDTLDPGAGAGDLVDGQDGDDRLNVRDNAADLARGGAGADTAEADIADVLVDVETKLVPAGPPAPPAADTKGTAARVLNRRVTSKLKRGVYRAKVRVQCPASEAGGCRGALVLQTARNVTLGGTRFHAVVASKRYTLRSGQRKTLTIKFAKGVRVLSRNGTLSLNAITTNRDAAGNFAQRSSRLAVKLVR